MTRPAVVRWLDTTDGGRLEGVGANETSVDMVATLATVEPDTAAAPSTKNVTPATARSSAALAVTVTML
jgi:hypothetical protein